MGSNRDYDIGKAGEYIVCADLILKGFRVFPVEHAMKYDLIMEYKNRLLKIQVKSTRGPRKKLKNQKTNSYIFHTRVYGKKGGRLYNSKEIDIIAMVALDSKKIAYILVDEAKNNMTFRTEKTLYGANKKQNYFKNYPIERCLNGIK